MPARSYRLLRRILEPGHDSPVWTDTLSMRDPRPSEVLYELLEEIGAPRDLCGSFALLDRGLRRVLPFDAMSVFVPGDDRLVPVYGSCGGGVPGIGIAGRVAETGRPAFNRDPQAEGEEGGVFRSMLAVPLDDDRGFVGVMALYSRDAGGFEAADLGVLLWIRVELARALRRSLAAMRFAEELTRLAEALHEAAATPVKQTA